MESAKRAFPTVEPVVADGIRYEAARRAQSHGFTQSNGVVAAVDHATGEIVWMVQLYANDDDDDDGDGDGDDGQEERDCRETDIRALALDATGRVLLATDGRRRVWSLDLATRAVTRVP